jgi:DNA-binding MarR family transcriptional regulator
MAGSKTSVETIASACIAGRLRILNRVVTNLYDDALRPLGVRLTQGNILAVTARLGVARPAQVCDLLQLDASTLSRTVERMVSNGWLEVVPDADARAQPFQLTDKGRRLMEKAIPAWERAQRQARQLLGDDILALLDRAVARLAGPAPTDPADG